jgi:5-methyltetrahydrofolate--homocysteine methyltransferase
VAHARKAPSKPLLSLEVARQRGFKTDWKTVDIAKPAFTGVKVIDDLPLAEIRNYIDWSPFFHAWEIRGRYPALLDDPETGARCRELFDDAQKLLDRLLKERLIRGKAVYGFFPAASGKVEGRRKKEEGLQGESEPSEDDIVVFADETRTKVLTTFHTLRQQMDKPEDQPNYALADFIAPAESGRADYIGAFAVTSGLGVEEVAREFEKDHDDYNAIMTKALADRLAEASAEWLHRQARLAWGFGAEENLSNEELIKEKYRGIRPAPGYPAQPDHTEKRRLFDLLGVEKNASVVLTENFAMHPASSVSGLYFAHPDSKYFGVGMISRDQAQDYAKRKGFDLATMEKWLAPNLAYDPEKVAPAAPSGPTCGCGTGHGT